MKIIAEFDKCRGCSICLLECTAANEHSFNPRNARMKVVSSDDGLIAEPVVCNQCENAFCEKVCPVGAIERHSTLKIPVVNGDKCTGCGICADYCPRGVIRVRQGQAVKCHLCNGKPVCVRSCPTEALKVIGGEPNNGCK